MGKQSECVTEMKVFWKDEGTQRRLHAGMTCGQKKWGRLSKNRPIVLETQHVDTCSSARNARVLRSLVFL